DETALVDIRDHGARSDSKDNTTAIQSAIAAVPAYQEAFGRAFPKDPTPVSYDNVAKAIAAFEDTLVTPSRFDRFLAGNHGALSNTEREGLKLFMGKGCASCHQGVAVGGSMYAKFGVTAPYANQKDPGRFKVTGKAEDMYAFKVPSLRNITRTGPYFHDGQVADLEAAVAVMAETQLGTRLDAPETRAIVAFLGALEGSLTPEMTKVPAPLK
ncbi:MAG: cytochrome c peroxidase, partial [Candidatus Sericytochromatia bacterium]